MISISSEYKQFFRGSILGTYRLMSLFLSYHTSSHPQKLYHASKAAAESSRTNAAKQFFSMASEARYLYSDLYCRRSGDNHAVCEYSDETLDAWQRRF